MTQNDDNDCHSWTDQFARMHLFETFKTAVRQFPDIMDEYADRLIEVDPDERVALMRDALRETVLKRYPVKVAKVEARVVAEGQGRLL